MKVKNLIYIIILALIVWGVVAISRGSDDELAGIEGDLGAIEDGLDRVDGEASALENDLGEGLPGQPDGGGPLVGIGEPAGPNKGVRIDQGDLDADDIRVTDQVAGRQVSIDTISLSLSGWAVVYEDREGSPGNIIGAQRFDVGAYSGGTVDLLRPMVAGNVYYAMVQRDDGDKEFNHKLDLPILDESEQVIMISFVAE